MENVIEWIRTLFGGAWTLMCNVDIPGFGISAAKFAIGFFVIKWSLSILGFVTGFRSNAYSASDNLRASRDRAGAYRDAHERYKRFGVFGRFPAGD